MKLETSEEDLEWVRKRVDYIRSQGGPFILDDRIYCDFLTLLAERAQPLPAEVEEMRKRLDGPHDWGYPCLADGGFISDPAPFDAASLLSRWPGGWRPIETVPKDAWPCCILENSEGWVGEAWFSEDSDGWWMANTHPTDAHDGQVLNPTGWMPLPAPGAAP